jgi:hypothetical protein
MANKTHRFTIALDDDSNNLLRELEKFTGLSPSQTVAKLFPSHLEELWAYLTWLEQLPNGPSRVRSLGCALLQSYGPSSLVEDIKRLDPTYQTEAEKLAAKDNNLEC